MSTLIDFGKEMWKAVKPPEHVTMADDFFRVLKESWQSFMKSVPAGTDYEVKFVLADGSYVYADTFGCENPCTIVVHGRDPQGRKVTAIMHYQTVQVVLTTLGRFPE